MHSYYKKILESKKKKGFSITSLDFLNLNERPPPTKIPEIHIPISNLYRSREFKLSHKDPEKPRPPTPKPFKLPPHLQHLESVLKSNKMPNYPLTRNGTTKSGQRPPHSVKSNSIHLSKDIVITPFNESSEIQNGKIQQVPDFSLKNVEPERPSEFIEQDDPFVYLRDESPKERYVRESHLLNPISFQRAKKLFNVRYDPLPAQKVQKINEKLELTRAIRKKKRQRFYRASTEMGTEPSPINFNSFEQVFTQKDETIHVPLGGSTPRRESLLKTLKSTLSPEEEVRSWIIQKNDREIFDEEGVLRRIEADMKSHVEKWTKLRGNMKRTRGDKIIYFDHINEKHLKAPIEAQRKVLDNLKLVQFINFGQSKF